MKMILLIALCLLAGCAANAPYRHGIGEYCSSHLKGCGKYIETHNDYDLGFIEFSERGNDFSPENTQKIMNKINQYAGNKGVALVVFIHGWKHNASTEDKNVKSFNQALEEIAGKKLVGNKRLMGIYIGWRGKSLDAVGTENLTFWDRKAVAEEVGRRGVTSVLLDMKNILDAKDSNIFLIAGHSFGAAVTLSALQGTLMERMRLAENGGELKQFSDGIVLLNPAIEANQGLVLKESSMRIGYQNITVPTMMYVISSRADIATNLLFPVGQSLGVNLRWNQAVLRRNYFGYRYDVDEAELDRNTIGNYRYFTTGYIEDKVIDDIKQNNKGTAKKRVENMSVSRVHINKMSGGKIFDRHALIPRVAPTGPMGDWELKSNCVAPSAIKTNEAKFSKTFPCFNEDPIDFISVPKSFIADHGDIFNLNLRSFLATIIEKAVYGKTGSVQLKCMKGTAFSFEKCFEFYQGKLNPDEKH